MSDPLAHALRAWEGRWWIVASTFPMWLKGGRRNPCFNYRVVADGEAWALDDRVAYQRNGRERVIAGVSRPLDAEATHFTWRGRGWLAIARSRWEGFAPDPERPDVVAVLFERTLFTPAGLDVIARSETLDDGILHATAQRLRQHPRASAHVDALLRLPG